MDLCSVLCKGRVGALCAVLAAAGPLFPWRQLRGSQWTNRRDTVARVQKPSVRPRPGWKHIFSSQSWCYADLWGRARGLHHQKSADSKRRGTFYAVWTQGDVYLHTHTHTIRTFVSGLHGAEMVWASFVWRLTGVSVCSQLTISLQTVHFKQGKRNDGSLTTLYASLSSGFIRGSTTGRVRSGPAVRSSSQQRPAPSYTRWFQVGDGEMCMCLTNLFSSSRLHTPDPLKSALSRTTQLVLWHTDCNSCLFVFLTQEGGRK